MYADTASTTGCIHV